jgi:hypothetical protein
VLYLQKIYNKLVSEMSEERIRSADVETEKAIRETHSLDYDPDQNREQKAANW